MVIHFRELLQYYQGIFAYLRITYHTFGANEGRLNLPEILKKKATIALPDTTERTKKNTFSPFVLVLIVVLHSVSIGKLLPEPGLTFDYIGLDYINYVKTFFFSHLALYF